MISYFLVGLGKSPQKKNGARERGGLRARKEGVAPIIGGSVRLLNKQCKFGRGPHLLDTL